MLCSLLMVVLSALADSSDDVRHQAESNCKVSLDGMYRCRSVLRSLTSLKSDSVFLDNLSSLLNSQVSASESPARKCVLTVF